MRGVFTLWGAEDVPTREETKGREAVPTDGARVTWPLLLYLRRVEAPVERHDDNNGVFE